ncbi:RNA-directed DNA polymerase, eukaryota [Tanacetum coccineum]|uniref:RNA-directed DNA polymerase, eukaryota n=1 Tax=Tanacetum coccineum TaxID=301880 RepID=A0ABQ5D8Q3_9ASTR
MGMYRSKEDELAKLSSSIFVTNFLDKFSAKELWTVCKQYGTMVDAFIPDRRSKAGKRIEDFIGDVLMNTNEGFVNVKLNIGRFLGDDGIHFRRKQKRRLVKGGIGSWFALLLSIQFFLCDENVTGLKSRVSHYNSKSDDELSNEGLKWYRRNSSEDPFNIYDLLDKKKSAYCDIPNSDDTLKYPPGFTPETDVDAQKNASKVLDMEGDNSGHKVQDVEQESVTKNNSPLNSYKNDTERSTCSGHFKKCDIPRSGGSILQLMEELIKVGQTMGYNMEGCITNIGDIINSQGANDETKMEDIELFNIKLCWGNFGFEFVHSPSVGNSGGILCIWDPRLFRKLNSTISDYFVIIQGEWAPNGKKLIIISVYAPQELREKKMLWDYLILVLKSWNGDVIIMGDFNEVRTQDERHGSIFNAHGADAFNLFISSAGLEEVPLDGCKFTWCHKSGSKMSKLDRFLISEGLLNSCPNISSITLYRYLSDHRPILMRDRFECHINVYEKIKYLKEKIRMWVKANKGNSKSHKQCLQEELSKIDLLLDKGEGNSTLISKRMENLKSIQDFVKLDTMELAQKAKIKWAIEGDENSKFDEKWCGWIQNCLLSSKGSVIVNGSPTKEFQFHRGLKQGDPLSPLLFLLIMESLHISMQRGITLFDSKDRWRWSLEGCGEFTVTSVRNLLDANSLPVVSSKTRWIKVVPIKVNIHAWKDKLDILPTRLNISKRGIDIESILCPLCEKNVESSSHIFFTCPISREIFRNVLLLVGKIDA